MLYNKIMLDLSKFANRLKELMIENNINASDLADKIGVDKSTVSRYLSAEKLPSVESAVKLSDFFGYKIDFILALSEDDKRVTFKSCPPFSQRLKFLLKSKQKTQYQLKKQTKISQSLVYNWLHDKYNPSFDNVIKMAKFFNCSSDYVLGRIDYE